MSGYAALFKHPNDELNYCVYLIPGNPSVLPEDLSHWHDKLMKDDPYISKALGSEFKIERMKAGVLCFSVKLNRLGLSNTATGSVSLVLFWLPFLLLASQHQFF